MKQIIYVTSPKSNQIHVWQINKFGALSLLQIVDTPGQGQPMVIHPSKMYMYVGVRPYFGIVSYRIDKNGLINQIGISQLPMSPTQLSIDSHSNSLYSVSYNGNCLIVSQINDHGIVGATKQTLEGLINCHSANVDTTNNILWVPCLKEDRIRIYDIDPSGYLTPSIPAALNSIIGSGPRHMAFHNCGNYAYVINELSGTVNVIDINLFSTGPRIVQTIDIMPVGFKDTRWASDIHLTPDNKWLYCCDRTASIICQFAVSEDGSCLSLLRHKTTEIQPRGFNIDKNGKFLIVAGQKSHYIAVYNIDVKTGTLSFLSRYAVGKEPIEVLVLSC